MRGRREDLADAHVRRAGHPGLAVAPRLPVRPRDDLAVVLGLARAERLPDALGRAGPARVDGQLCVAALDQVVRARAAEPAGGEDALVVRRDRDDHRQRPRHHRAVRPRRPDQVGAQHDPVVHRDREVRGGDRPGVLLGPRRPVQLARRRRCLRLGRERRGRCGAWSALAPPASRVSPGTSDRVARIETAARARSFTPALTTGLVSCHGCPRHDVGAPCARRPRSVGCSARPWTPTGRVDGPLETPSGRAVASESDETQQPATGLVPGPVRCQDLEGRLTRSARNDADDLDGLLAGLLAHVERVGELPVGVGRAARQLLARRTSP